MKKLCLIAVIALVLSVGGLAFGETFSWTNPTEYTDGSPISSQDQGKIKTHIYWSTSGNGPWTEFAMVENGASQWVGTPPAQRGVQAYYTLRAELNGLLSDYMMPAVAYTRPFVPTKSPSGLTISP